MIPSAARVMNQSTVIGPKKVASRCVPRDWNRNSPTRITADSGRTQRSSPWPTPGAVCRPSTAPITEIAGVMMPSP